MWASKMEIWDLYTKDGQPTGKTLRRGEPIPDGYYHPGVHVWIKYSEGQYLMSQRAADRPTFPLKWECVGGSMVADENPLAGALREVQEELGVTLDPRNGTLLFTEARDIVAGVPFYDYMYFWLFHYDGDFSLEDASTKEVAQARWMTVAEIQELQDNGTLSPPLTYFFTKVHHKGY